MHMADALISPAVGGTMWAVSAGLAVHSARKIGPELAERKAPLMGVLGAFVFAAQMINFTIPMTGSSGHLAGGMLLAVLLGPHAAFLVMFSILAVQALFFADGGLLALGCNVFNLGFWPCFVVYPLVFRRLVGASPTRMRLGIGAMLSAILALQLGAFGVVIETRLSGISELPFGTFLLLMQPIHLAIGIVEGIVTAGLIAFVSKARPEILAVAEARQSGGMVSAAPVLAAFGVAAVVTAGLFSWFASTHPDGLEWSLFKVTGATEVAAPSDRVHEIAERVQRKTAILPDYDFARGAEAGEEGGAEGRWPAISAGTSLAGLVGGAMVLVIAGLAGVALRRLRRHDRGS